MSAAKTNKNVKSRAPPAPAKVVVAPVTPKKDMDEESDKGSTESDDESEIVLACIRLIKRKVNKGTVTEAEIGNLKLVLNVLRTTFDLSEEDIELADETDKFMNTKDDLARGVDMLELLVRRKTKVWRNSMMPAAFFVYGRGSNSSTVAGKTTFNKKASVTYTAVVYVAEPAAARRRSSAIRPGATAAEHGDKTPTSEQVATSGAAAARVETGVAAKTAPAKQQPRSTSATNVRGGGGAARNR